MALESSIPYRASTENSALGGRDLDRHSQKSFACPFFKRDPSLHPKCSKVLLTRISYVKQHLHRLHSMRGVWVCPVCKQDFATGAQRDMHLQERSCQPRLAPPFQAMDEKQEYELRKRADQKMSPELQWFAIYRLLFPAEPVPLSPYASDLSTLEEEGPSREASPDTIKHSADRSIADNSRDSPSPLVQRFPSIGSDSYRNPRPLETRQSGKTNPKRKLLWRRTEQSKRSRITLEAQPASEAFLRGIRGAARLRLIVMKKIMQQSIFPCYKHDMLGASQIRIMILQPGEDEDLISVKLESLTIEELHERYEYAALSYSWWGEPRNHPTSIQVVSNESASVTMGHMADVVRAVMKQRLYINRTLDSALRQLRNPTMEVPLWVDAVCIDQQDRGEVSLQASRMPEIYSQADEVIIWLGEADEYGSTDRVMNDLQRVLRDFDITNLSYLDRDYRIIDLLELFRRRWFSRLWPVQDIVLAKRATVLCGALQISWRDFVDAVSMLRLFPKKNRGTHDGLEPLPAWELKKGEIAMDNVLLLDRLAQMIARARSHSVYQPSEILENIIALPSRFVASYAGDYIWVVIGIVSRIRATASTAKNRNASNPLPIPDYTKDILHAATTFVRWIILETGSLNIICRKWMARLPELPSWIKCAPRSPLNLEEESDVSVEETKSLVGRLGQSPYDSSYALGPTNVRFGTSAEARVANGRSIFIDGMRLNVIIWVSKPITNGHIDREITRRLGWKQSSSFMPDRVWRTLVADRDSDGAHPPAWYHRACLRWLADDPDEDWTQISIKAQSTIMASFKERVRTVTHNRRFLEATSGKADEVPMVGIGPAETQTGDIVCILFGCSVPCILRPVRVYDADGECVENYYELVGEAFIYGVMDGEAISKLSRAELALKTETFHIQ